MSDDPPRGLRRIKREMTIKIKSAGHKVSKLFRKNSPSPSPAPTPPTGPVPALPSTSHNCPAECSCRAEIDKLKQQIEGIVAQGVVPPSGYTLTGSLPLNTSPPRAPESLDRFQSTPPSGLRNNSPPLVGSSTANQNSPARTVSTMELIDRARRECGFSEEDTSGDDGEQEGGGGGVQGQGQGQSVSLEKRKKM